MIPNTPIDPVMVDGYLEEHVDGEWVVHTEVHMIDDEAERITAPGTLALSGHVILGARSYSPFSNGYLTYLPL